MVKGDSVIDVGYMLQFPKILVTGYHRSGTRIIAKILAKELGYRYVDEREVGHDDFNSIEQLVHPADGSSVVIQCPGAFYQSHLHGRRKRVLIVKLNRPRKDVLRSQKKSGFNWELDMKRNPFDVDKGNKNYSLSGALKVRDMYWKEYKDQIVNLLELDYESFSTHPMWLPKEKRKNFKVDQTCI